MQLGSGGNADKQVPLEDCPIGDDEVPPASARCNTVACPVTALALLGSEDGACKEACGSVQGGVALVCASSAG